MRSAGRGGLWIAGALVVACSASSAPLRDLGAGAGVRIGAAVQPALLAADPDQLATFVREFDSLTAENAMKWGPLSSAPGVYDFSEADELVDLAEANGMRVRGHTLVWEVQLPAYVANAPDAETLRGHVEDHIATVMGHYKGRVEQWDVVNEPLFSVGPGLDPNVFFRLLGPDYIADAFHLAHAADPDAILFLNEVLLEDQGARFDAFFDLVQSLLAQDVPVHGVGLQTHIVAGDFDPDAFEANLRALAGLGVQIEITELDVSLRPLFGPRRTLEEQAEIYGRVASACAAVPLCTGITTWGVDDGHTWLDRNEPFAPNAPHDPLLFDRGYAPKPAYDAFAASLPEPSTAVLLAAGLTGLAARRRASVTGRA